MGSDTYYGRNTTTLTAINQVARVATGRILNCASLGVKEPNAGIRGQAIHLLAKWPDERSGDGGRILYCAWWEPT